MLKHATHPIMNVPLRTPWTQDEFLRWASTQEVRYEFDGFEPVAMTGGTLGHSMMTRSLHRALDARLRGKKCQPLGPDAGVSTRGQAVRYPDALVTCSKFERHARIVPKPVVVFEVISSSTSRTDRIIKVSEYGAVASIRRYVILESTSVGVTVLTREHADEQWRISTLTEEDTLRMPEIGIEIPVAEFYEDIDFSEGESQGE